MINFRGSEGRMVGRYVSRLVLEAFRGCAPYGEQARHLDGVMTNNRLDNLAWGTPVENAADKVRHGTSLHGERNHQCKLSDKQVKEIRASRDLLRVLAMQYGVRESTISRIRRGVRRGAPIL